MAVQDASDVDVGEDPAAGVAALFDEHYSPLMGLAIVLTSDRELAEDLAQESFARLLRNWDRLRDKSAAPSYLRTTLVNLARSALRRRLAQARRGGLGSGEDVSPDPADRVAVLSALRRLPYRQRVCVALRFYEGLSAEDVAGVMGTSVGTVKSQTHKALKRLERSLEEWS